MRGVTSKRPSRDAGLRSPRFECARGRAPLSDNGSPDFTSYTAHLPRARMGSRRLASRFLSTRFIEVLCRPGEWCRPDRKSARARARAKTSARWILDAVRRHVRVCVNFRGNRGFLSPLLFEYVNAKFSFCTILRKSSQSRWETARWTILRFMSVEEHQIVLCVISRSEVSLKGLCKCLSTSRVHTQESNESRMKM